MLRVLIRGQDWLVGEGTAAVNTHWVSLLFGGGMKIYYIKVVLVCSCSTSFHVRLTLVLSFYFCQLKVNDRAKFMLTVFGVKR